MKNNSDFSGLDDLSLSPLGLGKPGRSPAQFLHWRVLLRLGALPAFVLFLLSDLVDPEDGCHWGAILKTKHDKTLMENE